MVPESRSMSSAAPLSILGGSGKFTALPIPQLNCGCPE
jgi:hypothetical protein